MNKWENRKGPEEEALPQPIAEELKALESYEGKRKKEAEIFVLTTLIVMGGGEKEKLSKAEQAVNEYIN